MDLLILAAGQGSRFGGPKQFEPIDENGNFIMDYSIYDAIEVGFDKVVIITRKCFENLVQETLVKRLAGKVKVEVVFQENDYIKQNFGVDREKPLGTGFAVMLAENVISDNFCIINADDFYGKESFKIAYDFMESADRNSMDFGLIGYELKNTLSEKGAVKRGMCLEKNGYVTEIVDRKVEFVGDDILVTELDSGRQYYAPRDTIASMNMLCFTPKFFEYVKEQFKLFCASIDNLQTKEFSIPNLLDVATKQGFATIKLLRSPEKWIGMTYKEDKEDVVSKIGELVKRNLYTKNLWEK